MIVPPFLIGAALLFWGWQTGHIVVGGALGIALEALRYVPLRFELGTEEHSRIADLSTVGFVTLAGLLAANRGVSHGIIEAFIWTPVALAPVLLAQMLSQNGRIPLSALFRYMRKLRQRQPEIKDPPVDVSGVYAALILVSAGVANARGPWYYVGVVVAAAWALHAVRPARSSRVAWLLMIALAAGVGHAGQAGIASLQAQIEAWAIDFNLRGLDADPYRTVTAIGTIGRLKQYDAILLRVYADRDQAVRTRLLHRASYNAYSGASWFALEAPMRELGPQAGGTTWLLGPDAATPAASQGLRIMARFDARKALLPLPPQAARIEQLPAASVRMNSLGAVYADTGSEWTQFEVVEGTAIEAYAGPTSQDSAVPAVERAVLAQVVEELGLRDVPAIEVARRVEKHLAGFTYSLYRGRATPKDRTALAEFLTDTRSGHCEYFAAAATLLLRSAGVPARYATGYAAMEYSELEQAIVVRSRHAHAWTRAWIDGRWIDIDPTPPDWFGEEAGQAPFWQGLADLARWAGFRWATRGEFRAGDAWYGVLAVLALVLAWRLFGGRRVAQVSDKYAAMKVDRRPGMDSEFYSIERHLPVRGAGETQTAWLARVSPVLPDGHAGRLGEALRLHQRYRFDPEGIAAAERERLRFLCGDAGPQR